MYYNTRNLTNINKLANNTKAAAIKWYNYCLKNDINILVYETIRTEEKQREYVNSGASQTMTSYHRVGQALDFVPVNDKGVTLWGGYGATDIKKAVAYAKSLGFKWGGDWTSFVDKPHLEFRFKGYGSDPRTQPAPNVVAKPVVVTKPSAPVAKGKIEVFQDWLNSVYKTGIKSDNLYGPKTKKAAIKALQTELNKQYNARLVVDGIWGSKTQAAIRTVSRGAEGNITRIIQGILYCLGYDPKGFDGDFGNGSYYATLTFQKDKKLTEDGKVGKNTFAEMLG